MNYRDIIDTATEFGIKVRRDFHNASWQCWADRIAMLPMAAERGTLVGAIAEANRYAGR